jgi:hypothetical protein
MGFTVPTFIGSAAREAKNRLNAEDSKKPDYD